MKIPNRCPDCGHLTMSGFTRCDVCGCDFKVKCKPKAQRRSRVRLQGVVAPARERQATTNLIGRRVAPTKSGSAAVLDELKAELNERRLKEISAMLDDAGVPEWVENNCHRGVPSNSDVMRLKWYLARRKNVSPREIDQKLQREMKEAERAAREYMAAADAAPSGQRAGGATTKLTAPPPERNTDMPKAKLKSKTTSNRPAQRRLRVQRSVSQLNMWAVIIKSARSEWIHWQTVERTKMQAWQKYLDQWNPEYRHIAEKNRRKKQLRLAKVTVAERANASKLSHAANH